MNQEKEIRWVGGFLSRHTQVSSRAAQGGRFSAGESAGGIRA